MSPFPSFTAQLRLVRSGPAAAVPHRLNFRSAEVEAENALAAAALAASDPRWVLAVRTATLLEGGRAAVLSPERRQRIQLLAQRMGLRPFDAALVMAVVQDAARAGENPLGREAGLRLALVRPAPERGLGPLALMVVSALLGAAMLAAVIRWVAGA